MPAVADPVTDPAAPPPAAPATEPAAAPTVPAQVPAATALPDPRDLIEQSLKSGAPVKAEDLAAAIRAVPTLGQPQDGKQYTDGDVIRGFAARFPELGVHKLQFDIPERQPAAQDKPAGNIKPAGSNQVVAGNGKGPAPSADLSNAGKWGTLKGVAGMEEFGANALDTILSLSGRLVNATSPTGRQIFDTSKISKAVVDPIRKHAKTHSDEAQTMAPPTGLAANVVAAIPEAIGNWLPYLALPEFGAEGATEAALSKAYTTWGGKLGGAVRALRSGVPAALKTGLKMGVVEGVRASDRGPEETAKASALAAVLGAAGFPVSTKLLETIGGYIPGSRLVPDVVKRFAGAAAPTYLLEQTNNKPQDEKLATSIAYGALAVPGGKKAAKTAEPPVKAGETAIPPGGTGPGGGNPPGGGGPGTPPGAPGTPPAGAKLSDRAASALNTMVMHYMRDPAHAITQEGIAKSEAISPESAKKVLGELIRTGAISLKDKLVLDSPHVKALIPEGWTPPAVTAKPAGAKTTGDEKGMTPEQEGEFGDPNKLPAETPPAAVEPVEAATTESAVDPAAQRAANLAEIARLEAEMKRLQGETPPAGETPPPAPPTPITPPEPPTPITPPTPPVEPVEPVEPVPPVEPKPETPPPAAGPTVEPRFEQLPPSIQQKLAAEALRYGEVTGVTPEIIENAIKELASDNRPTRDMLRSMGGPGAEEIYNQHLASLSTKPSFSSLSQTAQEEVAAQIHKHRGMSMDPENLVQTMTKIKQWEAANPDKPVTDLIKKMGEQSAVDLFENRAANPEAPAETENSRKAADEAYEKIKKWAAKLTRTTGSGRDATRTTEADVLRGQNPAVADLFEKLTREPAVKSKMTKEEADAAITLFSSHIKAMNKVAREAKKGAVTNAPDTTPPPEAPITKEQADAHAAAILGHGEALGNSLKKSLTGERGSISGKPAGPEPGELSTAELIHHLKGYGRYLLQQGIERSQAWLDAMTEKFGNAIDPKLMMGVWQDIMERGRGLKPPQITLQSGKKVDLTNDLLSRLRAEREGIGKQKPGPEPAAAEPARIGPAGVRTANLVTSTSPPAKLRLRSGEEVEFPAAGLPEVYRPGATPGPEAGESIPGGAATSRLAADTAKRLGIPIEQVHELPVQEGGRPLSAKPMALLSREESLPDEPGRMGRRSNKALYRMTDAELAAAAQANKPVNRDAETIPVDEIRQEMVVRAARKTAGAEQKQERKAGGEGRVKALTTRREGLSDKEVEGKLTAAKTSTRQQRRAIAKDTAAGSKQVKAREAAAKTLGTGLTPPAEIPKPSPIPEPLPEAGNMQEAMEKAGFKDDVDRPGSTGELLTAAGFQARAVHRGYGGKETPHIGGERPEKFIPEPKSKLEQRPGESQDAFLRRAAESKKLIQREMPISGHYANEIHTKNVADGVIEVQAAPGNREYWLNDESGDPLMPRDINNEFLITKHFRDGRPPVEHHGSGLRELWSYLNDILQTESPIPLSARAGRTGVSGGAPLRSSTVVPETTPPPDAARQRLLNKLAPPPKIAAGRKLSETMQAADTKDELNTLAQRFSERATEQSKIEALPEGERAAAYEARKAQIAKEQEALRIEQAQEKPEYAMTAEEERVAKENEIKKKKNSKEKSEIKKVMEPNLPPPEKNAAALAALGQTEAERTAVINRIKEGQWARMTPEARAAKIKPVPEAPTGRKRVALPEESPFTVKEHGVEKVEGKRKFAAGTFSVVPKLSAHELEKSRDIFGSPDEPLESAFGPPPDAEAAAPKSKADLAAEAQHARDVDEVVNKGIIITKINDNNYQIKIGSGKAAETRTAKTLRGAQLDAIALAESMLKDQIAKDPRFVVPGVGVYKETGDAQGKDPEPVLNKKTGEMETKIVDGKKYEFTSNDGQVHTGWMPLKKWNVVRSRSQSGVKEAPFTIPRTTQPPAPPAP